MAADQQVDDVGFDWRRSGLAFRLANVANLSGEARWATYVMESDFLPTDFTNCTGLRMCLAGGTNNAPVRWVQNTNAEVDVKNHVYEGALEFNVPLLKDVPGFQDLSTNLAGRWTKYSTFDAVESWKLGLNWQIIDSIRVRSTLSSDIRAPNLNDLFQPAGLSSSSYNDRLTGGFSPGMRLVSSGNALLTPEEGKTFTVGGADAELRTALQPRGRLLRDQAHECDNRSQLCKRLRPGHLPGHRADLQLAGLRSGETPDHRSDGS
jgi:outer membrane receptor protein involved in Fe transport